MTLQEADKGDTTTQNDTLCKAGESVAGLAGREARQDPEALAKVNAKGIEEMVVDKGCHSDAVVERVKNYRVRAYIPERQQKRQRNWKGKQASSRRSAMIGGGCRAATARACCDDVANWWNEALLIAMTPAGCSEPICANAPTSSSGR